MKQDAVILDQSEHLLLHQNAPQVYAFVLLNLCTIVQPTPEHIRNNNN